MPETQTGEAPFAQELDLGIRLDKTVKLSSDIEVATRELLGQEEEERGTAAVRVCAICWVKVEGLFYFCAQCGHVAHVACVGSEKEGAELCVAHCGCDCVVDEDDKIERQGNIWWVDEDEDGQLNNEGGVRQSDGKEEQWRSLIG